MNLPAKIHTELELADPNKTENALPQLYPVGTRECRICLNGAEQADNRLVSPCECQGSMRHVHEGCLQEWLSVKALRADSQPAREVECELCKAAIRVELQMNRRCNSCAELRAKIDEEWILFVVCLLGMAFSFGLIAYTALQLRTQLRNGYGGTPVVERIVVISSLVLNLLLILYFGFNLSKYFLRRQAQVRLVFK